MMIQYIPNFNFLLVCRTGIQLVLNSKVSSVEKNKVQVDTNGKISTIPFGACVWSTGVAMHPLIKQLQARVHTFEYI